MRISKSIDLGNGIRLNLSNRSVGVSAGLPGGVRVGLNSRGAAAVSIGLPGTGARFRARTRGRRARARTRPGLRFGRCLFASHAPIPGTRAFARGLLALANGNRAKAFHYLVQAGERGGRADAACLLAASCAPEPQHALALLERVEARKLPGRRLLRYWNDPTLYVGVTPAVVTAAPINPTFHALLLAHNLRALGHIQAAIDALEGTGGTHAVTPARTLALASLYAATERFDPLVALTDETRNFDDVTAEILVLRARALSARGDHGSALAALREALRYQRRGIAVILAARYERACVYEVMGQDDKARKEFETVHALDSDYRDVAQRIRAYNTPPAEHPNVPPALRVRDARRRAGLTQRELAKVSGVGQQTICKIEIGAVRPKPETLERLLRACTTPPT